MQQSNERKFKNQYFPKENLSFIVSNASHQKITLQYKEFENFVFVGVPINLTNSCVWTAVTGRTFKADDLEIRGKFPGIKSSYIRYNPFCMYDANENIPLKENLADILMAFRSFEKVPPQFQEYFNFNDFSYALYPKELESYNIVLSNRSESYSRLTTDQKEKLFNLCVKAIRQPRFTHSNFLHLLGFLAKKTIFHYTMDNKSCPKFKEVYPEVDSIKNLHCECNFCLLENRRLNLWFETPKARFNDDNRKYSTLRKELETYLAIRGVRIHPGWTYSNDKYAFCLTHDNYHTSAFICKIPSSYQEIAFLNIEGIQIYDAIKEAEKKVEASKLNNSSDIKSLSNMSAVNASKINQKNIRPLPSSARVERIRPNAQLWSTNEGIKISLEEQKSKVEDAFKNLSLALSGPNTSTAKRKAIFATWNKEAMDEIFSNKSNIEHQLQSLESKLEQASLKSLKAIYPPSLPQRVIAVLSSCVITFIALKVGFKLRGLPGLISGACFGLSTAALLSNRLFKPEVRYSNDVLLKLDEFNRSITELKKLEQENLQADRAYFTYKD